MGFKLIVLIALLIAGCSPNKPVGEMTPLERGEHLFELHQCYTCHRIGFLGGMGGPVLSEIGSRRSEDQLRQVLINPQAFNPSSKMPKPRLSPSDLDYLVLYLSSLTNGAKDN